MQNSDVYVASGLIAISESWTYRSLAEHLRVSVPLVQRSLKRLAEADLYEEKSRRMHAPDFDEFAVHGLRFVAPAKLGPVVSGVPAAWAAEPLAGRVKSPEPLPPVWPHPLGSVRGHALTPLHGAAPDAVHWFPELGRVLAVLDALRFHDRRVRKVAQEELGRLLRRYAGGR